MHKQNATEGKVEKRAGLDVGRRNLLKLTGAGAVTLGMTSIFNIPFAEAQDMSNGANNFYTSDKVTLEKVTFKDQYQMKVAGNLYTPKNLDRNTTHPAIVVSHPMGAVKEQSATAASLNCSPAKWVLDPTPEEPNLICPGCALASAIRSLMDFTPSEGAATTIHSLVESTSINERIVLSETVPFRPRFSSAN
jgi:hypothetical protein